MGLRAYLQGQQQAASQSAYDEISARVLSREFRVTRSPEMEYLVSVRETSSPDGRLKTYGGWQAQREPA